MSKYIVCVFDDKKTSYEGARALRELDDEGSIAAYEGAIISKAENGAVRIEDARDEGPINTLGGMMIGSLIGVIGGPAGVAVGAAAGTWGGMMADMYNVGVSDEFLDEVAKALTPGKYAVVAEVEEGWTVPLDTRMEELGGIVFRRWRFDVEEEQIDRDIQATRREIEELEEEWDQASGEAKEKLKTKVLSARDKMQSLDDRTEAKAEELMKQNDAKVEKLNQQIAKASGDFKTKLEKARSEIKTSYEKRSEKLKQASKLAKEALS